MTIAIEIADPRWPAACADIAAVCERAAIAARAAGGRADDRDMVVMLADDATLRDLNARFRDRDAATNVLAFPAGDVATGTGMAPLGDIALAFETVAAESAAQNKRLVDHAAHLVVHGVLHLLGFDHMSIETAGQMEQLEIEILGGLGIANPYVVTREADPVP